MQKSFERFSSGLASDLKAGHRAPDAAIGDATIFERSRELVHHLLVFADSDSAGATSFADGAAKNHLWLRALVVEANAEVARKATAFARTASC